VYCLWGSNLHGTMVQCLHCLFKPDILSFLCTVEMDLETRAEVTGLESVHFIHCNSDNAKSKCLYWMSLRLGCYPAWQQVYRRFIPVLCLFQRKIWEVFSPSV
jgi:hypothetical protein